MILNVELIKKEAGGKNKSIVGMVLDIGPLPVDRFDFFNPIEQVCKRVVNILCNISGSVRQGAIVRGMTLEQAEIGSGGKIHADLHNPMTGETYDLILIPQKHITMLESGWIQKLGVQPGQTQDHIVSLKLDDGTLMENIHVKEGRKILMPLELKGKVISDITTTENRG